jgi:uncharacterized protein (UPF0332 family)
MRFDWTLYLQLADAFIKSQPAGLEEAYLRSAVSRAYYGAFCPARNFLTDKRGISPPADRSVHEFVINNFKNSASADEQKVGLWLDRLRRERNDADYNDTATVNTNKATLAVFMARQVISELRKL